MNGLPEGFLVGHRRREEAWTGCTVVIAPPGSRAGCDVRGGGPGTREIDVIGPLAAAGGVTAVVLAGGSAYGLAAADGAMRWLSERGRGYQTPLGLVPIVPGAVIYDESVASPRHTPDVATGWGACELAAPGVPQTGAVGAGTGAMVAKILGRDRASGAGVGFASGRTASGRDVAALAVVNAMGDVIGADGSLLAGPRDENGRMVRTTDLVAAMSSEPRWTAEAGENTTLVCVMTDATLDAARCAVVARMTSAGIARAIEPVFTPVDGDVAFCVSSGQGQPAERFEVIGVGTLAAQLTAAAIRGAVSR